MENGNAYIPMDWRHAIAANKSLPQNQSGAALFADISGFTPLTEAFALELGPKRGGEELTIHLNRVYDQIISVLHRYHGSVIGFSGDSITCWFDQDLDGRHAVRCALEMQEKMSEVASIRTRLGREIVLGLKVSVALGPVKRFIIGMDDYKLIDAMAGKTVERMAAAEEFASAGDVVIDEPTHTALADHLTVSGWHEDEETSERYATVTGFDLEVPLDPWPEVDDRLLSHAKVDEWLLPAVASRINSGLGDFLTELRPAAALFMRFTGIEFESDDAAPEKLNKFVQSVQRIIMRLDGSLIQLTIGDKGSYLYAAFGAPVAHENDVERAAIAALALQEEGNQFEFINSLQIGISHGLMRTGAYGGGNRRTYGVLGDHVNLSARLMGKAPSGQIYVSQIAYRKISKLFDWVKLPAMMVKGKSQPIQVFRLTGSKLRQVIRLTEPEYNLPMIGREAELNFVSELTEEVLEGKGQIIGITAEAGMGKSRLSAEVIQVCMAEGMSGYGGECQSFGTNTSYLVWQPVIRSLFKAAEIESKDEQEQFVAQLHEEIELLDPSLVPRIPLLAPFLQIEIPENDLTKSLDAKTRKSSLEAFIIDVFLARSLQQPIILVFEDCHWLDPLSLELIEALGRSIEQAPILMLLVYRPPDSQKSQLPNVHELPYFTEIRLDTFSKSEAEELIQLKVKHYLEDADVPQSFSDLVIKKAAGNPFYLDEIINFIQDKGVDLKDEKGLASIDLPNTIYSLVLSRIDNLTESQKMAIKVASVIGRLFTASMVWGIYPTNEVTTMVKQDLDTLSRLELTPIEKPEPELSYLFKHIVTQEVAYESLPYKTREKLHRQIGFYIESVHTEEITQYLDLLAFHYGLSDDEDKKREYLIKAGIAAQDNFANTAAISYFGRAMEISPNGERIDLEFRLAQIYDLIGNWEDAENLFQSVLERATNDNLGKLISKTKTAIGELKRKQGDQEAARSLFGEAEKISATINDHDGLAKALICSGTLTAIQGDFPAALQLYERSLNISREQNDQIAISKVLNNMAIVAQYQDEIDQALTFMQESLNARREINDRWGIANSLNNLGVFLIDKKDFSGAKNALSEALVLNREIGDKWSIANTLNNLGNVRLNFKEFENARQQYSESLQIYAQLGDKWALSFLLEDIGSLLSIENGAPEALQLAGAANKLREEIESPLSPAMKEQLDQKLSSSRENLADQASSVWEMGMGLELPQAIALAQNILSA